MKKYFLGGKGKFYKAQLHAHSTVSDGILTPQQLKDAYMVRGYSILAFSDHEILVPHNELSDENFLAITAYEQSVNERFDGTEFQFLKCYHLNFISKDKDRSWTPCYNKDNVAWLEKLHPQTTDEQKQIHYPIAYNNAQLNDMLQKAKEHGFLVVLNHPSWSQQSYVDYIDLDGLWGVEVYNHSAAVNGFYDTIIPFEDLLKAGKDVVPISADDMHDFLGAFGSFTMIEAESLDYDCVLRSMEDKRLYASNGPTIDELFVEDGKLTLRCSKVSEAVLRTERRWIKCTRGENLTEVTFDISEWLAGNKRMQERKRAYIRLAIKDKNGKMAWTRAYFEDEFE